jgi:hypothetical protein
VRRFFDVFHCSYARSLFSVANEVAV